MYKKLALFEEPNDNSICEVTWYDNDRKVDIITRKNRKADFLKQYKRISADEYFNPRTGNVEKYKRKDTKNKSVAYKNLKISNQYCLNTFEGNETEKIIELYVNKKIKDTHQLTNILSDFLEDLKQEIKPVMYIRVLLYKAKHEPICHFWLKTKDNSKLEISQELLEKLWKKHGTVKQIDLTKENREEKAEYHYNGCKTDCYPRNIHILSCSRDIKPLRKEYLTRVETREKLKGFVPKYQSATVQVEKINGEEIELQRTSYESYVKVKDIRTVKLYRNTIHKRYKGIIIKGIYAHQQEQKLQKELEINQKLQEVQEIMKQKNIDSLAEIERIDNKNEFNLICKNTKKVLPLKHKSIEEILALMKTTKAIAVEKRKEELDIQRDIENKADTLENLLLLVKETNWNINELAKDRNIQLSQAEKEFISNMKDDYNQYEIQLNAIVNRYNRQVGRKVKRRRKRVAEQY